MIRVWRRVLTGGLALFGLGCSDIFRPSYDYGRVEVVATDPSGSAVPAVRLTLYTGQRHMAYGETRGDGRYVFRFVPEGEYGIEAGAPEGYSFPPGALPYAIVDAAAGSTVRASFTFVRTAPATAVLGRVVAPTSVGFPGN